jgi:2-methylcitrate dehydratase PrpD
MNAALVNGMAGHAFDCDDTHLGSTTHPSSVLVPAALAAGEPLGADGRTLITGLVAGYELIGRLARAIPGISPFQRGFQVTSLYGPLAAAATVGKVMNLSAEQLTHAFGLAASQGSGVRQFSVTGEHCSAKSFHSGWPALGGILAAQLAQAGMTAARQAIDGEHGLYAVLLGARPSDPQALTRGLGEVWETLDLAPKAYAAVQGAQHVIETALRLRARPALVLSAIDRVELSVSPYAAAHLCEPWADRRNPADLHASRVALPFAVAAALTLGRLGPADVHANVLKDPDILALAGRISHQVFAPGDVAEDGAGYKGRIVVRLNDGSVLEERFASYRGDPATPMSVADYMAKFDRTATRWPARRRSFIARMILELETVSSAAFYAALSSCDPPSIQPSEAYNAETTAKAWLQPRR